MKYIPALLVILLIPCLVHSKSWYKGNTHVHTTLCGHADTTPDAVAQWYHDRGYNFLILSEHNKFIDPSTVELKGKYGMISFSFLERK